ncbi:MAG: SPOR domain-containing protein [Bacillota bacterium]
MSEENKKSGFSLTVIVIFMAVAAIFVGYLLGSWLIQFLNEDNTPQLAQEQSEEITSTESSIPLTNEKETETVSDELKTDSQTESVKEKTPVEDTSNSQNDIEPAAELSEEQNTVESELSDDRGDFGIQVGAFANYENAQQFKREIEEKGYNAIITDTDPHKVQIVGYSSREDAEKAEKEVESAGYNGFIVSF